MRCGRPEHQQGEKCAARNAKCKDCHKIGHFYKVCQSSKRTRRANLAQVTPQDEDDTYIDECGYAQPQPGYTQPNPPVVNMLKVINHTGTTSGTQFLKFPIDVDPRGTYKHHLEVSIDTGADVNCMNEKTFKKIFPEVGVFCMSPQYTELWKLYSRRLHIRSVSYILAVQGKKVPKHIHCHQCQ